MGKTVKHNVEASENAAGKIHVAGVDLGGTKIYTVLADAGGNIISEIKVPTPQDEKGIAVVKQIAKTIVEVRARAGVSKIEAVGVGAAGQLDIHRGIVLRSGNLGWRDVPLLELLAKELKEKGLPAEPGVPEVPEKELGVPEVPKKEPAKPAGPEIPAVKDRCPIFLDNDANLAALGEYKYGAGQGYSHLVYITVSTGIGGGIIINGSIYHGAGGSAGEIGHITVKYNGQLCSCGKRGCLEAYASGTAIARQARELVMKGQGRGILKQLNERQAGASDLQDASILEQITAVEVGRAAANGDIEAKAILNSAGSLLGVGIANVINILNPSLVILGGGVMNKYELMKDAILSAIRETALEVPFSHVQVVPAQLKDRAGGLGAAALALAEAAKRHF